MPREKETYRAVLADLLEYTGNRRLLTAKDVGGYLGIDPRTAAQRCCIDRRGIAAPVLASMLAR